ncbi:GNAT family N-acetyltransferase [Acidiphilium sp.]|uniref:GNAT family N-acetyltransferase n=1 Tax=Acidiphilium sp. TaxID=527 RepID=UPI003D02AB2F
MTTPKLDTARLHLTPVSLDDAPFVQAEFPHWEIVRFLNARVPWPYPDDGALVFYRDVLLPNIAAGREMTWSIRLRDAGATRVGVVTIAVPPAEDNRGFWIARAHQGQGYASEAADAVTGFYFDELDQAELRVSKAVDNAASRAVSARQGMRVVWTGERDYVSGRHRTETWAITRDEWRAHRSS